MKYTVASLTVVALLSGNAMAQRKPNIILFLVDDMGWQDTSLPFWKDTTDLNRIYETPNMERLAERGVMFTHAYACSISSPSRVSLFTGANAAQHKVTNWTLKKDTPTDRKDAVLEFEAWNYNGLCPEAGLEHSFYAKCLPQLLRENGYAYRKSLFKKPEMKSVFVTYVNFVLSKKEHYTQDYGTIRQELAGYPSVNLATLRRVIIDIRESKLPDPKVLGNAGSFFMNPIVPRAQFEALLDLYPTMPYYEVDAGRVKIPAGWMIDQCGWKGKALGPAAVHDKQALVLVNLGGATGKDVVALSDAVRASVKEKFGVEICPEVNFIE